MRYAVSTMQKLAERELYTEKNTSVSIHVLDFIIFFIYSVSCDAFSNYHGCGARRFPE